MRLSFGSCAALAVLLVPIYARPAEVAGAANAAIDMPAYLRLASEAARHRESRRLSERDFMRMSETPGTLILDARSRQRYDALHIKGALNLSFPDLTVASLAHAIPDKSARILIYCNNNFVNADSAFPIKLPAASLNLSTYVALYTYGYRNIYELGPVIDIDRSALDFEVSR